MKAGLEAATAGNSCCAHSSLIEIILILWGVPKGDVRQITRINLRPGASIFSLSKKEAPTSLAWREDFSRLTYSSVRLPDNAVNAERKACYRRKTKIFRESPSNRYKRAGCLTTERSINR